MNWGVTASAVAPHSHDRALLSEGPDEAGHCLSEGPGATGHG